MANLLGNLFGSTKSVATPEPSPDSDFADFAEAADPSPSPFTPVPGGANLAGDPAATGKPYTKWYNVHERYTWNDFRIEGVILVLASLMLILHLFGARLNRSKAKKWMRAHAPAMTREFALVGFDSVPNTDTVTPDSDKLLKEKSLFEFATYGTGRQNVAFVDVKLTLMKRFNPFMNFFEQAIGFFFDSIQAPGDVMDAIIYPFDGREALIVPSVPGASEIRAKDAKSTYDGFVFAIVNKEHMKHLRDDRYDVSITFTRDNSKLPNILTVMSESAEITETLLTPELVKVCQEAGEHLEYLIISDQPTEKPKTLDETQPRKRIFLRYSLPSNNDYTSLVPLFSHVIQLPDILVQSARFRPEVLRKVRNVREEAIAQIKKQDETEKAEERALEREKAKKEKRDRELSTLDAKAQKKYLEKERDKELRKTQKKQTVRG